MLAAATEGSLIEQIGEALHGEIDPRRTNYLLADWETLFGPDPYGVNTAALSPSQMLTYLYHRLVDRGGQSPAFYIGVAAALGVTISITQCRITRYDNFIYDSVSYVEEPANFQWAVILHATAITNAVYDSCLYDEPNGDFVHSPIEPVLWAQEPAHTQLIFSYTG